MLAIRFQIVKKIVPNVLARGVCAPAMRLRSTFEDREHAEEDIFIRNMEAKDKGKGSKPPKEKDEKPKHKKEEEAPPKEEKTEKGKKK